jgi:3-dehydrosphinganine reductase
MQDLDGKNVVVTGGSYGLGKEIARSFVQEGANVYLIARDSAKLDAAVQELTSQVQRGRRVKGFAADVSDREAIFRAVEAIALEGPGIDVLVNNAGIVIPGYFENIPVDAFETVVRTNYLGAVNTTKAALPHLLKQERSAISFTSSLVGHHGIFGYSTYGPTKAALINLAETIRAEMRGKGVQVSVLCPPDTDTPGLESEKKVRPPETNAISGSAREMPADEVAACFMRGFKAGKFMIICEFMGKLLYRLNGLAPRFVDLYMNVTVALARRKKTEQKGT